jgi:hypothetical protein
MNVHRSLWLALPLAFLLPIGCADNNGTGQATEAAAEAPAAVAAPAAQGHRHGHHARGPAAMLFHAARQLDLSSAQQSTIDQLSQQLHGDRGGGRAQHQAMNAALVEGVRAGSIDLARVTPLQAASDQARQAHHAREATALNGLWAALQPAQRQALVASVRTRQADRAERWSSKHAEGEAAGGWQSQRLAHLTTQLGLDAAQQQTVAGLLASGQGATPAAAASRHQAMKARTEALLTAFVADAFDASQLDLTPAGEAGPGQHRAQFLAQLVPVLRADQRETLAQSIENEHAHG